MFVKRAIFNNLQPTKRKNTALKKRKSNKADSRLFGIDVSHHQNEVQWDKCAAAGVVFAFLKATEASTFVDRRFAYNWSETKKNGIVRGSYHFFRPRSVVENQVSNFLAVQGRLEAGDLPPVLDLEVPESWRSLSLKKRIAIVRQWLDAVEAALDIKPIIYLSSSFAGDVLGNDAFLKNYLLWVANYQVSKPRVPAPWSKWDFWQYSETGKVTGVPTGSVDLNWFQGTRSDLMKLTVQA